MARIYGVEIAKCSSCSKPIGDNNPYSWCVNCGNPLSEEVKAFIPSLAESQITVSETASTDATKANARPRGVEDSLSDWGGGFLAIGLVSGLACLFAALKVSKDGIGWYFVIVGVGVILQAMFIRVLLEAGAEIIRLLRKLNDK